jgi:quercetin dioxygenase-like cupin family protein
MIQTLVQDSDIAWEELGGGLRRKVMSYDPTMMIVKVDFETGGIGAMHQHQHTQASYVVSGKFDITIGENTKALSAGDVYFVPSNLMHGAVCTEKGTLIDVFTPMREDFL